MTNSEMMISLLRTLKVEMNGAVAGAMEERGVRYGLNYGVSLPTIKSICSEYALNHSLAKLLYRQDIRELRLAALYVADPALFTFEESHFWAEGVVSSEIAGVLAMTMLSKSPDSMCIITNWLDSDIELIQYAALMGAVRCSQSDWNVELLRLHADRFSQSGHLLLQRAAELLNDRLQML